MQSAGASREGGGRKRACKRDACPLPGNSYPVINPKNRRMTNPGNAQMRASIRAMTITLPVFHVLLKNLQTVHLTRSVSSLSLGPTIFMRFSRTYKTSAVGNYEIISKISPLSLKAEALLLCPDSIPGKNTDVVTT